MVLSFAATNIQLGLLLHAGAVMTALKLSAKLRGTALCERFFRARVYLFSRPAACRAGRRAGNNLAGAGEIVATGRFSR